MHILMSVSAVVRLVLWVAAAAVLTGLLVAASVKGGAPPVDSPAGSGPCTSTASR